MALTAINNRPLVTAAPKAKTAAQPAAAPKGDSTLVKGARAVGQVAPSAAIGTVSTAFAVRAAFTPPLIVDIVKQSIQNGVGLMNLAWFVVPSAIRNVRDVTNDKISLGRGAANVITDTGLGVAKGIGAGIAVQSLQVIAGPLLGFVPAAMLPFAGLALGIGGLIGAYWVLGKVEKATGIGTKISNGLTKLFGGDKPAPAPEKA